MTKTTQKAVSLISLKVTLRHIRPPIWRRLVVPGRLTMGDLHEAIQATMGWEDCHLHMFNVNQRHYGDRRFVDDVADEERLTVDGVLKSGVTRFAYIYDFGDNWEHSVVIEKNKLLPDVRRYPACIAGRRNCPPEDCGGPWGYQHLVTVLADPTHPDHTEQAEWFGDEFDPDEFAVEVADATLAARFKLI